MPIRNILILSARGPSLYVRIWRLLRGDRLYTSESDVQRRQILTYKDGPRAKKVSSRFSGLKMSIQI